jgi:hypothetical protein
MSSYYLCDKCRHARKVMYRHDWVNCAAYDEMVHLKVMVDYGSIRGHMNPYDDPKDVCPKFERKNF